MGDNLENLVIYARTWFKENNVKVPKLAKDWQTSSVKRGELPPGTSTGRLRTLGITQKKFIDLIVTGNYKISHINKPITRNNLENILGFKWLNDNIYYNHKKVIVECLKCSRVSNLDYGTLKRMEKVKHKYCMVCRNVGGKVKPIDRYNIKGFDTLSNNNGRIHYKCNTCKKVLVRTMSHIVTSGYIVCEFCNPSYVIGCKTSTQYGTFDSKIESICYEALLHFFKPEDINRQVSYNKLFNTNTKHTADFYIPKINLILEITTKNNNIPNYMDTLNWKLSLSNNIKVAYSKQEVEDIVRAALKDGE